MDEIKAISDRNLKEPSKIFELKEKGIERIEIEISSKIKFKIGVTKHVIKKEQRENLPATVEEKPEVFSEEK